MSFRRRTRLSFPGVHACSAALLIAATTAPAQQLIGYVNTRDAEVAGASDVLNGQAVLTGSASVTARDHTASITLGRGGSVRVCQTSALHVTESKSAELAAPLLFSLDRGAIEIQTNSAVNDSIMTPDLRFTIVNRGPLDLRLRIARNGDTCVENRGPSAPTLDISDPFGESLYQVAAGQHVLFEHGSLHEVVDHETSSCGCPEPKGMSMADAILASNGTPPLAAPTPAAPAPIMTTAATPIQPVRPTELQTAAQSAAQAARIAADRAAAQHPFPEAISEGLAPPAEIPPAPPGQTHVQITDTLSYNAAPLAVAASPALPSAGAKKTPTPKPAKQSAPQPAAPKTATPASAPKPGLFHAVGRFFKSLFSN
jgi:hypothetical protein